jgi:hypothetical protein
MVAEIQKFTKLTFIIHFVIGLIFTILFFMPEINAPIYGLAYTAGIGALSMLVASLFAGWTVTSLGGILAKEWTEVRYIVIAEIIWLIAGFIASIINFGAINITMAVVTLIIFIVMILLFVLTFLQQEGKIKPLF